MLAKFKGCLIGLAVGDYLGMPVEFMSEDKVKRYFGRLGVRPTESHHRGGRKLPAGYYTDDTALTICIAESLIEKGFDVKDQFTKYKKWYLEGYATPFGDKAFGIGQNTLKTLISKHPDTIDIEFKHDERKGGNGALMRCAPLGLLFHTNEQALVENTLKSTITTHNNGMAVWTSIAQNLFISYALKGYKKETYIANFLSDYPEAPTDLKQLLLINPEIMQKDCLFTSGYSLHTFLIAVHCFMTTTSYKDAVSKAILLGGDTDTQGSVTGALAGAYYGFESIPTIWMENLLRSTYIVDLSEKLHSQVINSLGKGI